MLKNNSKHHTKVFNKTFLNVVRCMFSIDEAYAVSCRKSSFIYLQNEGLTSDHCQSNFRTKLFFSIYISVTLLAMYVGREESLSYSPSTWYRHFNCQTVKLTLFPMNAELDTQQTLAAFGGSSNCKPLMNWRYSRSFWSRVQWHCQFKWYAHNYI